MDLQANESVTNVKSVVIDARALVENHISHLVCVAFLAKAGYPSNVMFRRPAKGLISTPVSLSVGQLAEESLGLEFIGPSSLGRSEPELV